MEYYYYQILVILVSFIFFLSGVRQTLANDQDKYCPKRSCTCNELEIICKGPIGAYGIPHTLDPNTKRIIMNNAQTNQFSGLDILVKLETIDLAYNKLPSIDFNEITKNKQLTSMNVSHNIIRELKDTHEAKTEYGSNPSVYADESDISKKLEPINVVDLVLSNNQLTTIRNLTFLRWNSLRRLDLSFNYISSLESHSLIGLIRLEVLNLRGNRLTQVPTKALHSTIQPLPLHTLSGNSDIRISNISHLDLSQNNFNSIDSDSFSMLERTQELYLESCSIQSIHEQAFKGLHTLFLLSLDKNELQEVPSRSFSYLGLLRVLKVSANKFTRLQPDSFSQLMNLEELQLNNGSFTEIPREVFNGLDSLRRLELAYNPHLTHIYQGVFENLSKLTYLSLFSDSLSSLSSEFNDKLYILDLRGNPLNCGCDLKWLTRWLKNFNETVNSIQQAFPKQHLYSIQNQEDDSRLLLTDSMLTNELLNLTCHGPPALNGKPIVELPENKLECLRPESNLNVNIGFATLFFISFTLTFVCLFNFCKDKKHIFVKLKENLVQSSMIY